jgi:hypothetical protein
MERASQYQNVNLGGGAVSRWVEEGRVRRSGEGSVFGMDSGLRRKDAVQDNDLATYTASPRRRPGPMLKAIHAA